jgi:hypothetical protein
MAAYSRRFRANLAGSRPTANLYRTQHRRFHEITRANILELRLGISSIALYAQMSPRFEIQDYHLSTATPCIGGQQQQEAPLHTVSARLKVE